MSRTKNAIENTKAIVSAGVPTFGICLGHQLLARAFDGNTFKLPFGHHGGNHPVKELATGTVEITSQNHNFCVDADSLAGTAEITHVNLNDSTNEGMRLLRHRAFSVQYHPEVVHTPAGQAMLQRFLHEVCECRPSWTMWSIIDTEIAKVRQQVGTDPIGAGDCSSGARAV